MICERQNILSSCIIHSKNQLYSRCGDVLKGGRRNFADACVLSHQKGTAGSCAASHRHGKCRVWGPGEHSQMSSVFPCTGAGVYICICMCVCIYCQNPRALTCHLYRWVLHMFIHIYIIYIHTYITYIHTYIRMYVRTYVHTTLGCPLS